MLFSSKMDFKIKVQVKRNRLEYERGERGERGKKGEKKGEGEGGEGGERRELLESNTTSLGLLQIKNISTNQKFGPTRHVL